MLIWDLIDLARLRRAILYVFCVIVTLWLQTGFFSRIAPLGVKPFFVPLLASAIGLWEGGVWGGIFGLVSGLLCDLEYLESTVTYMILFSVFGFAAGVLGQFFVNRRFVAFLFVTAGVLAVTAVVQIVPMWIFRGTSLGDLLPVQLLQLLWSFPFAVPIYFAVRRIARSN